MSDQDQNQLDAVRKRVKEIQRARRSGIRWRITKHTAELTMRALEGSEARPGTGPELIKFTVRAGVNGLPAQEEPVKGAKKKVKR